MSKQTAEQLEKALENDYPMIPMSQITDEARMLAVAWGENMVDKFINQKQKLASDIMNYARRYASPSPGWIKASERLPEKPKDAIWRYPDTGKAVSAGDLHYALTHTRQYPHLLNNLEWLSESPAKPEGEGKGGDLVCDHCNGMGQRMSGGDIVECEQCGGDGEYVLSYDEVCNELSKTKDLLDTSIFLLKGIAQDMNTGGEHQSAEWLQKSISEIISKK